MSADIIPDQTISVKMPRNCGKIEHGKVPRKLVELFCAYQFLPKKVVELFGAYQFSQDFNRAERNFHPMPPVRNLDRREYYNTMFRLRINGKWYMPKGKKYVFFSKAEIAELLLEF